MTIMLLQVGKNIRLRKNMELAGNPSKKIRFDNSADGKVNDDLWGQDDMTAEEFDMLEIQATQVLDQENRIVELSHPCPVNNVLCNGQVNVSQCEEMKYLQYELEGKVKLLTHSLEKTLKELREEKLQREKVIAEKIGEFQCRESKLQKEIEKMQSNLQFKEQEMKSVYNKVKVLESHLQEKKENVSEPAAKRHCNEFLKRFYFESECLPKEETLSDNNKYFHLYRKYKLTLDSPQGETKGSDIVSSILCNRLDISTKNISTLPYLHSPLRSDAYLSAFTIARLNYGEKASELFQHFVSVLELHVEFLQSLISKTASSTAIFLPTQQKEVVSKQHVILLRLRDIVYILSSLLSSSVQSADQCMNASENKKSKYPQFLYENVPSTSSVCVEDGRKGCAQNVSSSVLKSLFSLANPETYPNGYCKEEEMEWSLAALFLLSYSFPQELLVYICGLCIHSFLRCEHGISCLSLTLKLITNLSGLENSSALLVHKSEQCVICSVGMLLSSIITESPVEFISPMIMVEDFLSSVFTLHISVQKSLESECSSKLVQGVITSLLAFYEVSVQDAALVKVILRKGFILLHLLSNQILNFKEVRNSVEDSYISLVCGMLTLSKEDPDFKEFYDIIHNLWDFQEDVSEFDLDDPADETILSAS